ncbi:ATP-binding protein [Jannaschia sp. LMIT008]|uniref:ATP-binding protein n=1 Tax=Jannaschia maritima TaxID=3032585 RepID=UPI0028113162|nr:ATP-binding protein [Jannaschia sp. LMIT008]
MEERRAIDVDGSPGAIDVPEGEIVALRVGAIVRLTPMMMGANIANVTATLLALWWTYRIDATTVVWAGVVCGYAAFMLWTWFARRNKPFPRSLSPRTERRVVVFAVILGLIWAYPGLGIMPDSPPLAQAFLIALCAGMTAGGSLALHPVPIAALLYAAIVVAAHMVGFALTGHVVFWAFAIVAAMFFGVVVWSTLRHEQIFLSEFLSRQRLDRHAARVEQMLDDARRDAVHDKAESEARLAQVQRLDSVGRLTAGIAHDFNNLLAAIMGNIELARLDPDRSDLAVYLDESLKATRRGAHLTEQLLSFGCKAALRPEPTDLATVGAELLGLVERTFPANVSIDADLGDGRFFVNVDPTQLQTALLNLLLNARDALRDGGTIGIVARTVEIEPGDPSAGGEDPLKPGAYVEILVRDDGSGIPPDALEHVFDPFFTTKEIGEGSGLGLAMVYGFVRQSGGDVTIESEPAGGTRVRLFLPAATAPGDDVASSEPDPVSEDGDAACILLVEDDADVRRVVDAQLRHLGYRTLVATDGTAALELLRGRADVDLLLTDLAMPGPVQGDALISLALAEGHVGKALCMSGRPDIADAAAYPRIAGVPIVRKPVDMAQLAREVERLLSLAPRAGTDRGATD